MTPRKYLCTGTALRNGVMVTLTAELEEWWYEGRKVETIEETARGYFYDAFDKAGLESLRVEQLTGGEG